MAKDFIPDPDDVTADYPGSVFAPWPILDRSTSHSPIVETFTVPGSASDYTVRLDFGILQQIPMTVTDTTTSTVLLPVPWDVTPGTNEVAVNFNRGLLRFNAGRDGNGGSISYQPIASVIDGMWQMTMQKELQAVQSSAARRSGGNTFTGAQEFDVSGNPSDTNRFLIRTVGGSGGAPHIRFRDQGQSRNGDIRFNEGGNDSFTFSKPIVIPSGTNLPAAQLAGTVHADRLPSQAARRDQANTFALLQTMNMGAILKQLVVPPTVLDATAANVDYQLTVTDTWIVLQNSSGANTINMTLPPLSSVQLGHMKLFVTNWTPVNGPVLKVSSPVGSQLISDSTNSLTTSKTLGTDSHFVFLIYAETNIRWRLYKLA